MRPYSRVSRLEKKNARRLNHTNTAKKRSALRGGHGRPKKRIKNAKMRLVKDEQVAGPSTSRVATPEGNPHSPLGPSTSRGTAPRGKTHSHSGKSTSRNRKQRGIASLPKSQHDMLKNRFTHFARCLMLVWWHACLNSGSFLNHVNTFQLPTREQMSPSDYLYEAARVMFKDGIDASVPLCDDLVREELRLVKTINVSDPSVMIQNWTIFHFVYDLGGLAYILTKSLVRAAKSKWFNGKQIMIWARSPEMGSARDAMIALREFPMFLTVRSDLAIASPSGEVELQFQGVIFGNCLDPNLPEITENYSIVYLREKTGPVGSYLLYDSKWNLPEKICSDYQISSGEGLLVLYTI